MTTTKFANGKNPFAEKKPHTEKKPRAEPKAVNMAVVAICNDPLPGGRAKPAGERKYDARFEAMKPGQALKCDPGDVGKIAHAMSVWIKRKGLKDHVVRSSQNYETDDPIKGRVWLVNLGPKGGAA